MSSFIEKINIEINERKELGIPNVPLNTTQVNELCNLLEEPKNENTEQLLSYLINRIIPGVDETSYIKANSLNNICNDEIISPLIDKENAIKILGTMQGGYNTKILIDLLDDEEYGYIAINNYLK